VRLDRAEGPDHRLRVNTAGVFLERDVDGALLVTDLVNFAMPLIPLRGGIAAGSRRRPRTPRTRRPVLAELEGG